MRWIYEKPIPLIISVVVLLLAGVVFEAHFSGRRAREEELSQDLRAMRSAINQYTHDKQRRPRSLEDLVSAGYVKSLPDDPFTGSNNTWVFESVQNGDIASIHSGSNRIGSNGKPYSSW